MPKSKFDLTQTVPGSIYLVVQIATLLVGASVLTNYWLNTESISVDAKELNRGLETTNKPSPTPNVQKPEGVIPDNAINRMLITYWADKAPQAYKVMMCESGGNPKAKNKNSTASGLFQIIRGTFKLFKCEGDVFSASDNIACAYKLYERNQSFSPHWDASKDCWSK